MHASRRMNGGPLRAWNGAAGSPVLQEPRIELLRRVALWMIASLLACTSAFAAGYTISSGGDTGEKPQSKVWYHDGSFWAAVKGSGGVVIHEKVGNSWVRGGFLGAVVTNSGHPDVKWNGSELFILVYADITKLYKYTYDSTYRTWNAIAGFPVNVPNPDESETMVLEQDTSGRLWVTTESGDSIQVYYTTSADHMTWAQTPVVLETDVDADDISSIIAFGGNKVGVFWSDQNRDRFGFRIHRDTDPPEVWQPLEIVAEGSGLADDHLSLAADASGRVYALSKDDFDAMQLHRRSVQGTWTTRYDVVGHIGTRGILQLSEDDERAYILYTNWHETPFNIEYRIADLEQLEFQGTTDFISAGFDMNNVTGTKQLLPAGTLAALSEGNAQIHSNGWGAPSTSSSLPPKPPADLTGRLQAGPARTQLSWSAPGGSISGYNVYRQTYRGQFVRLNTTPVLGTQFTDLAPPEMRLFYRVTAVRSSLESSPSLTIGIDNSPVDPPFTPTDVTVTQIAYGGVAGALTFWFDEGSGQSVEDLTGQGHGGQLGSTALDDTNDPTWVAGVNGMALRFDGNSDYVRVPDANLLDPEGSFTIDAWLRRDSAVRGTLVSKGDKTQVTYRVVISNTGRVEFTWENDTGTLYELVSNTSLASSTWQHVACVYDRGAGENRIYIDGAEVASALAEGTPVPNSRPLYVGARVFRILGEVFSGSVDQLRIVPEVLYHDAFVPMRNPGDRHAQAGASALVHWKPPVGGGTPAGYRVYRRSNGGAAVLMTPDLVTGTAFREDQPAEGQQCYWVVAENAQAEVSATSAQQCVSVDPPPPSAPLSLVTLLLQSPDRIELRWQAPVENMPAVSYHVYRQHENGVITRITSSPVTNRTYVDSAPLTGKLCYRVTGVDQFGREGMMTASTCMYYVAPTVPAPSAPLNVTAVLGSVPGIGPASGSAAYPLDEGDGQTSLDQTTKGHTAQLGATSAAETSDPRWTAGISGSALLFDGNNDYAQAADAPALDFASSFTVEAWVKLGGLDDTHCILGKGDSGSRNYWLQIDDAGLLEFRWETTGGSTRGLTTTVSIQDDKWHHIAGVYDQAGAQSRIYVDGVQAAFKSETGTPATNNEPLLIGARKSSGKLTRWFLGSIDLVRVSPGAIYTGSFTPLDTYAQTIAIPVTNLSWQRPAQGYALAYHVQRSVDGGSWAPSTGAPVGETNWVDPQVVTGTLCYRVAAVDPRDREGAWSTSACVVSTSQSPGLLAPPALTQATLVEEVVVPNVVAAAAFEFDTSSGNPVDVGPHAHATTLGATSSPEAADPTWTSGVDGGALLFDGTDDYVTVADGPALDIAGSFTLEAWLQVAAYGNRMVIAAKGLNNARNFWLLLTSSGYIEFVWETADGTNHGLTTTQRLTDNAWHHVAAVYDQAAGRSRVFVDGTLWSEVVDSGVPVTNNQPMLIGTRRGSALEYFFNGKLDLVRLSPGAIYTGPYTPPMALSPRTQVKVNLAWQAPAGIDITGYQVFRSAGGNAYEPLHTGLVLGTQFADLDLPAGQLCYHVRAVDALLRTSAASNAMCTMYLPGEAPAPGAPQAMHAATIPGSNGVLVSWTAPAEGEANGYDIYRSIDGAPAARLNAAHLPATNYVDAEPPIGNLCYTVIAFDDRGRESAASDAACIAVEAASTPPGAPLNLAASLTETSVNAKASDFAFAFDEASGNNFTAISGHPGTLGTTSAADASDPTWTPGVAGSALQFDGINDLATATDDAGLDIAGSFTVEAWVKRMGSGVRHAIASKGNHDRRNFYLMYTISGYIELGWTSNGAAQSLITSTKISDTNWHHIAGVYDQAAGQMRIFIDGNLSKSASNTTTPDTNDDVLLIGARRTNGAPEYFFNGVIDMVRITPGALYSSAFTPALGFPPAPPPVTTTVVGLTWEAPATGEPYGYNVMRSHRGAPFTQINELPVHATSFLDAAGTDSTCYFVQAMNEDAMLGPASNQACLGIAPPLPDPPAAPLNPTVAIVEETEVPADSTNGVASFGLDEAAGQLLQDATGFGNHAMRGTSSADDAADPAWTAGMAGAALQFDGTDDHASAADAARLDIAGSFTVEAWVKRLGSGVRHAIVSKGNHDRRNFYLMYTISGYVELGWTSNGVAQSMITGTKISDTNWHHIAGVYDQAAGQMRIFIDGKLSKSASNTTTPDTNDDVLLIGARRTNGALEYFYNGVIDLVRVTPAALYSATFTPPSSFPPAPAPVVKATYAELRWDAAAAGTPAVGYNVMRSRNGDPYVRINAALVLDTAYRDSDLSTDATCYVVHAVDADAQSSPASDRACLGEPPGPPAPPEAPENLQVARIEHVTAVPPVAANGVVQLLMDEAAGQSAQDASGFGNHATRGASAADDAADPAWTTGMVGTALQFDGSNDYASAADAATLDIAGSFTVEAWVKRLSSGVRHAIVSKGNHDRRNFYLMYTISGYIELGWTSNGAAQSLITSTKISDTNWHHIAGVYDQAAGQMRIFIDGALSKSASNTTVPDTNDDALLIGARRTNGALEYFFNGAIDMVRVTPGALYAATFTPPLAFPAPPPPTVTNYAQLQWQAPAAGTPAVAYNLLRSTDGTTWLPLHAAPLTATSFVDSLPGDAPCYVVHALDALGQVSAASDSVCLAPVVPKLPPPPPPPLPPQDLRVTRYDVRANNDPIYAPGNAAYMLDEAAGQSLGDATQHGNHASLGTQPGTDSADPTWTAGFQGGALQFDGSNDYASAPDAASLDISGSFTVEAWVKRSSASARHCIISKGNHDERNLWLMFTLSGYIEFGWETADGTNHGTMTSAKITDNSWHHIAAVYDMQAGQNRIYVDGVLWKQASDSGTPNVNSDVLLIGARRSSGVLEYFFHGAIDMPRVSAGALYTGAFTPPQTYLPAPEMITLARLDWNPAERAVGYNVFRRIDTDSLLQLNTALLADTSYVDSTYAQDPSSACWVVVAVDSLGQQSDASATACTSAPATKIAMLSEVPAPWLGPQFRNAPNPFNPTTTIRFSLPQRGPAKLAIYDVRGRLVQTLIDGTLDGGEHAVVWSGTTAHGPAAAGIYFAALQAGSIDERLKLVLVK